MSEGPDFSGYLDAAKTKHTPKTNCLVVFHGHSVALNVVFESYVDRR